MAIVLNSAGVDDRHMIVVVALEAFLGFVVETLCLARVSEIDLVTVMAVVNDYKASPRGLRG